MSDDAAIQATNVPDPATADTAVSGQITVAVVLLIVALFIAILIMYLRYSGSSALGSSRRRRSSRLAFAQQNESASRRNALDRSILESLPVAVYRAPEDGSERGLECAVCICELAEGEEARFLPKCNHAFHVECIDMWFGSNSTCPLCRLPVAAYSGTNDVVSTEMVRSVNDDDQEQGSTSSSSSSSTTSSGRRKELVIEIPRRVTEGPQGFSSAVSPLPSTRRTPVVERLRSLGRMMSSRGMGKGVCCSSTTPRPAAGSRDIEQGPIGDDVSKRQ